MALMAGKATLPIEPAATIANEAGMLGTQAIAPICSAVAARPACPGPPQPPLSPQTETLRCA